MYNGRNKSFFYVAYERFRERSLGFGAPNRTQPLPEFYDGDFSRLLGPATGMTDANGRSVARGANLRPGDLQQSLAAAGSEIRSPATGSPSRISARFPSA